MCSRPVRGSDAFPSSETARVHHAARRRGSCGGAAVGTRGRLLISVAGGESRGQSGLSVHSSAPSALLAPMLSRSRSVVERSAPMPFSSCPVERNPRVERGSFNIVRRLLFWLHSRSAVSIHILPGSSAKTLSEVLPVRRRDNLSCQINFQ